MQKKTDTSFKTNQQYLKHLANEQIERLMKLTKPILLLLTGFVAASK